MKERTIVLVAEEKSHIERCLATIESIKKHLRFKTVFITTKNIRDEECQEPKKNLSEQIMKLKPTIVIFDQHKTQPEIINSLRIKGVTTINQCYKDPSRNLCDIKISPLKTHEQKNPGHYEGTEYCALRRKYYTNGIKIKKRIKKIMILNIKGLPRKKLLEATKDYETQTKNNPEPDKIKEYDLAITTTNNDMYKCLAIGIPTMIISLSKEEEQENITFLMDNQSMLYLGNINEISVKDIKESLLLIDKQPIRRKRMHFRSRKMMNRESRDNIHKLFKELMRDKH